MRHLLEILCASDEFRVIDINIPDHHSDFIKLEQEIMKLRRNRNMAQNVMIMFKDIPYIRKSTVLITANLLGLDIPSSFYDQYLFAKSKVPKILNGNMAHQTMKTDSRTLHKINPDKKRKKFTID